MKICRFRLKSEQWFWGELISNLVHELALISADPLTFARTDREHRREDCELLLPCMPSRLVGIGDNFKRGNEDLKTPVVFQKPLGSLVPNRSVVYLPPEADTWGEPEIGVVVKKSCANLSDFLPEDYILGFCLINDTTTLFRPHSHDSHDPQAKGQPGFCQMGEFINTEFEYNSAVITGLVDGRTYRKGSTTMMKWDLRKILQEVSAKVSLKPFDVIFTGCPERVSQDRTYLNGGEMFSVEVAGLGELVTRFQRKI